jgi:hypothetical protein
MKTEINNLIKVLTTILLLSAISFSAACSAKSASAPEISTSHNEESESTEPIQSTTLPPATDSQLVNQSSTPQNIPQNAVSVVIAGYINHGPMQPTVNAIKEVLSKYGDKVQVQWVDLGTNQGRTYFKEHGLSAHMNVIINGKYEYKVNGKDVEFQWFEGTQWTKQDLDTVLAGLVTK